MKEREQTTQGKDEDQIKNIEMECHKQLIPTNSAYFSNQSKAENRCAFYVSRVKLSFKDPFFSVAYQLILSIRKHTILVASTYLDLPI